MALDAQFWADEAKRLYNVVFPRVLKAATDGARNALAQVMARTEIGVDWGIVNDAVYDWAQRYSFDLVRGINDTSAAFLQKSVSQWSATGAPLDDLMQTIEPMFGETRAKMIATTEVTRAYSEGNIASWKEGKVVDSQRWMTAEDDRVCPICGPMAGEEDTLGGNFGGVGIPPAHVNCRCWLQPVVRLPE